LLRNVTRIVTIYVKFVTFFPTCGIRNM